MSRKKLPIVAIVGRANVGKSSFFNLVLQKREAITANEPGTTRDSIMAKATIYLDQSSKIKDKNYRSVEDNTDEKFSLHLDGVQDEDEHRTESYRAYDEGEAQDSTQQSAKNVGRSGGSADRHANMVQQNFWLVDTAGLKTPEDDFEFTIQEQILQATDSADLIVVIAEANTTVTEEDRRVAKMALKSKKPVILLVNKVDKARGQDLSRFERLGIKPIFHTSLTQNYGISETLDYISEQLPKIQQPDNGDKIRLSILGRPNVGKSALFNSLSKKTASHCC